MRPSQAFYHFCFHSPLYFKSLRAIRKILPRQNNLESPLFLQNLRGECKQFICQPPGTLRIPLHGAVWAGVSSSNRFRPLSRSCSTCIRYRIRQYIQSPPQRALDPHMSPCCSSTFTRFPTGALRRNHWNCKGNAAPNRTATTFRRSLSP